MMKDRMARILRGALLAFLVVLVILFVFGLVLWLDWPRWMGFFLIVVLAAFAAAGLLLMKILHRRREQHFVAQVIEQDEARIKVLSSKEKDEMKVLQERWKEAVDMLRRSHLRKLGNPLYVLPWYMVIGESGSGKTTAINSAKLSSPFTEVKRVQGISGTKNCEWWFFEEAVIIDTAGRYAIPVDEGRDKDEWQKFLRLLVKYRRKEPLHGLIVAVAADKLLSGPPEVLEDDGKNIRRRVDELMRALGVKFPVYVLVTKCDLVQGMTKFSAQLPEKALDQPMGFVNQGLSKEVGTFLADAMNTISERLKNIRLLLLQQPASKAVDPALLLFPEEFEQLGRGLDPFMKAAFQENPYQETPVLRGIFFSSGHQEGTPYSHFLEALGLIDQKEVLPGTSKGLYLHEFFSRVLPSDRQLFAPTTRATQWKALTRNLGLTAWLLFAIAVCGLLSFSYVKNLNSMKSAANDVAQAPVMTGQLQADLLTMERFKQVVSNLETENAHWWIPRFGLTESIKLERGLKEKFCKRFREGFLIPFDRRTQEVTPRLLTASAPDEVVGRHIMHLVRRINVLKARIEGATLENLRKMPQPPYVSVMADQAGVVETGKSFGDLYISYILWSNDTPEIHKEMAMLRARLRELISAKDAGLEWLPGWVDRESGLPGVTIADFWHGSVTLPDERRINPAFTRKGKEVIDAFFQEVQTALPEDPVVQAQTATFDRRYRASAFDAWYRFAAYFPKGADTLKGAKAWRLMAPNMASDQGPYSRFLDKATAELEPLAVQDSPVWLQQMYQLRLAKAQGYLKDQGTMAKAAEQGKKLVATVEKKIGKEAQAESIEAQVAAGKAYQELMAAVSAASSAASSRTQSYQSALQTYAEEPGSSKSPFHMANAAAAQLSTSLGRGRPAEEVVSHLVSGPILFLWTTVRMETGCYLQTSWEEKVLAEAQGETGQRATQVLFAPDGPVWKFVKGSGAAAPFIGWSLQRGYYPKETLGGTIPFEPSFFTTLVKGAKVQAALQAAQARQEYNVSIGGLPTDANSDARLKPHATKLEMHCSSGVQTLTNFQYAVTRTFKWAPDACGEVVLQIDVGDLILTKRYGGQGGFPDFLVDFKGGTRTFTPRDFPSEQAALTDLGIKFIKVNYRFTGEAQVIGHGVASTASGQVATTITRCWAD